MHSGGVLVLCLRVNQPEGEWWVDLPELTSIQLGLSAFCFKYDYSSELIMRSISTRMKWWIDLPKLTSLSAGDGNTFCFPHHVTLKSLAFLFHSLVDIPELKEVVLPKGFSHARTVVTRGSIFVSHMSLLDVGAFQPFLSEKGIPTSHTVFGCCSTYSLPCYHTHSCTSHHSHFFHFLSILAISTHIICHTFSQSSLHSPLFFPILPTAFTHHS